MMNIIEYNIVGNVQDIELFGPSGPVVFFEASIIITEINITKIDAILLFIILIK